MGKLHESSRYVSGIHGRTKNFDLCNITVAAFPKVAFVQYLIFKHSSVFIRAAFI